MIDIRLGQMGPMAYPRNIMTSRERILCAINHRPTDRLPIDIGATRQSGIAASTYHALKKELDLATTATRVYDVYQMLAEVEQPVLERFGADAIGLNRIAVAFGIPNRDYKPWQLFDGTPVEVPGAFNPDVEPSGDLVIRRGPEVIARMPKDGFYFDRIEKYPGAAHVDVASYQAPRVSETDLVHFRAQSLALHESTDLAIVAPGGPPYELFYGLGTGDFERWMVTLATEPDYVASLYEKLTDAWIDNLQRFVDAVEDRVHIIQINDDLGTQHAPFLSVPMYRRLIMPHYKRGIDWIHKNTAMKVMLHSDGAIFPLIPSLIETGFDILNPVQTSADGMDAAKLKATFGDKLVFWGGSLDCQRTLPNGTPEEVRAEVQAHIEAFAPGGGYVFASVHNIQANIPPRNVIAMFDTALAYRRK